MCSNPIPQYNRVPILPSHLKPLTMTLIHMKSTLLCSIIYILIAKFQENAPLTFRFTNKRRWKQCPRPPVIKLRIMTSRWRTRYGSPAVTFRGLAFRTGMGKGMELGVKLPSASRVESLVYGWGRCARRTGCGGRRPQKYSVRICLQSTSTPQDIFLYFLHARVAARCPGERPPRPTCRWIHPVININLVHGQVTIIFVLSVCLFVQSFSQPSLIWFRSN